MKFRIRSLLATAGAAAALQLGAAGWAVAAVNTPSPNVAWVTAAADADMERAFAQARAANKPLFLYWGASWCPPCNQLKATLFNRQDFAALSRSFVPVFIDGDRPGAQAMSRRFQVSAYPTMVLLRGDGTEITRLPGEVDAPQVMAVLQQGVAGGRTVKEVLADALGGRALQPAEWRQLAFYSWELDDGRLVKPGELADTLARLAVAAPAAQAEASTRLWLKALSEADDGKGVKPDAALRDRMRRVLADAAQSRLHADLLTGSSARRLVDGLEPAGSAGRAPLIAAYDTALERLRDDASLSRNDRLAALHGRVELARLAQELPREQVAATLPAPLVAVLREQVAADDREIRDGYERQAVITYAAFALTRAGLWRDAESLLLGNLARSHSPYYLMSQLGGQFRRQGENEEALRWYQRAFERSEGPATRLQWGAGYLVALVDLAPKEGARIETVARQLFTEAAQDKGAFDGRSARSLQRVGNKLLAWNADGQHEASLKRLRATLAKTCAGVEAGEGRREACQKLLRAAGDGKAAA